MKKFTRILDDFFESLLSHKKIIVTILLLTIVIIAFWLRIRYLGIKDLWLDEYFTNDGAFYSLKKMWLTGHTKSTLSFSFFMKVYAYLLCRGRLYLTPFELRLPNVIFGTTLVFLVFIAIKKIANETSALLGSLICAVSYYMVHFSRDGRYYPFLLIWVIICFIYSINILSEPLDSKKQLQYHLLYMVGGIFGMFSHYGFWIFFALSNSILCIIFLFRLFNNAYKNKRLSLLIRSSTYLFMLIIPAVVPFIVYRNRHAGENILNAFSLLNGDFLLNSLSYSSINKIYVDFFPENFKINFYILAIISVMAIFLLLFYKQRKIVIYLLFLKFGTFLLLRFTPRLIVGEPLRSRYIIFILLFDIIIFSVFIDMILNFIKSLISIKNTKFANLFYLLFYITILISVSFYSCKNILKSSFYKAYNRPSLLINRLTDFYKDGDIILTDFMELHTIIPYNKRISDKYKNMICCYIGWLSDAPQKYDRIILITKNNVNKIPGISYIGNTSGLYINILEIPEDIYEEDISYLLSKSINTNDALCKEVLNRWSKKKSNVLDYLISTKNNKESYYLISNSIFTNKFVGWELKKAAGTDIIITNIGLTFCAKIYGKGGWTTISQKFNAVKGKKYKIIADICSDSINNNVSFAGFLNSDNRNENFIFPKIKNSFEWVRSSKIIECKDSGSKIVGVQYNNSGHDGSIYIKQIKVIELRDKTFNYKDTIIKEDISTKNNLVINGDFSHYFSSWNGTIDDFTIKKYNYENCLSLCRIDNKQGWSAISQSFDVIISNDYNLSYEIRNFDKFTNENVAYIVFSYQDKNRKSIDEKFIILNNKSTSNNWERNNHTITAKHSSKASLRIQYKGNPHCEIKNIEFIKKD